jgi:hypothetical protein
MCNCLKETETELREKLNNGTVELSPKKGATLRFLNPKNVSLVLREGKSRLLIPYEATWEMPPGKSGKFEETVINIIASHFPFCGQPIETEAVSAPPKTEH